MKIAIGLLLICFSISSRAEKLPCKHLDLKLTCSSDYKFSPQYNRSNSETIVDLQPEVFDPNLCAALVSFEVPGGRFHATINDDLNLEAYLDPQTPGYSTELVFSQTLASRESVSKTLPRGTLEVTFTCSVSPAK